MYDSISRIRDTISNAIQYDPKCQGFTLQILKVTPLEHTVSYQITITLSTDISPALVISYEQNPFTNSVHENLYDQLEALRDAEFYQEFER